MLYAVLLMSRLVNESGCRMQLLKENDSGVKGEYEILCNTSMVSKVD